MSFLRALILKSWPDSSDKEGFGGGGPKILENAQSRGIGMKVGGKK